MGPSPREPVTGILSRSGYTRLSGVSSHAKLGTLLPCELFAGVQVISALALTLLGHTALLSGAQRAKPSGPEPSSCPHWASTFQTPAMP